MKEKIPVKFKHLFWEYHLDDLDLGADKNLIIERITARGDIEELKWMFESYTKEEIILVLQNNYNVSTRAVKFWAQILNFNVNSCKCIQRPSVFNVFNF